MLTSQQSQAGGSDVPTEPIIYLFTTFPVLSETFLQREVRAMRARGVALELHSLWGGEAAFEGLPVQRFRKRSLWRLIYKLPQAFWCYPGPMADWLRKLVERRPISLLNLGENLLGIGFALVQADAFRRRRLHHFHGVWSTMPAAAALTLHRLTGHPYTIGAHAYDVFERGGDPFLRDKIDAAFMVHTSVNATRRRLLELTGEADKVVLIRRGLDTFPPFRERPWEETGRPLRLLSIGRLVEKKGFFEQLRIYALLRDAGFDFRARIIGEGPLREALGEAIQRAGLVDRVILTGALPFAEAQQALQEADVFLFTGRIAADGNRDGLPNVVPEAMASGAVVCTSPMEGVQEAITHGETGWVCPLDRPDVWRETLRSLRADPDRTRALVGRARAWVEEHFDANRNAGALLAEFRNRRPPSGEIPWPPLVSHERPESMPTDRSPDGTSRAGARDG